MEELGYFWHNLVLGDPVCLWWIGAVPVRVFKELYTPLMLHKSESFLLVNILHASSQLVGKFYLLIILTPFRLPFFAATCATNYGRLYIQGMLLC